MTFKGKHKIELGDSGEDLASRYLAKKGFKIIQRKFRCFLGEIDLIALDGDCLVFIEVKTRKESDIDPLESITRKKQKKLYKIAEVYLNKTKDDLDVRFDVVGIEADKNGTKIEHIENAFSFM